MKLGDVPKFSRWNHIAIMLVLIDKIAQLYKKEGSVEMLGISISSPVKLKNEVKFRSAEDFLKCWAMLYSIGHFVGTFASEHALLKCIVANEESKNNFLKALDEKFKDYLNYYLNGENAKKIAESVKTVYEQIIDCEDIFKLFKIFTTLKVLEIFNCKNKEDEAIRELAIFNFLREDYLSDIDDPDKRYKLERIIDIFNMIRQISYLILDGYFSQNFVNVNPQWLILNIGTVLNEQAHQELLNSLNLFYTRIIYQSPENMYYHHKFVRLVEDMFKKELGECKDTDWSSLINRIISNEIDKKIGEKLEKLKELREVEYKDHFARIIVKELSKLKPVTLENRLFGEIMGGVIYNIPADYYEIDIYYEPKSLDDIFKICKIVSKIYRNVMSNNKDEQDEDEQKQSSNSNLEFLISGFEDVGKKLAIATLKILRASHSDESWDYRCQKKKYSYSAIIFLQENKDDVNKFLHSKIENDKRLKNKSKKELETSLELISKVHTDHNVLYVYIPIIEAISNKKTLAECDFMLLAYNLSKCCLNIQVAEIKDKKKGGVKEDQLKRYCKYFLVSDTDELTRVLEAKENEDIEINEKIRINVKSIGSKSKLISKTIKCKNF